MCTPLLGTSLSLPAVPFLDGVELMFLLFPAASLGADLPFSG